jgi:hypothetical protein
LIFMAPQADRAQLLGGLKRRCQVIAFQVDGLLIAALFATALDAGTTCWFLMSGAGFETNPVLAPLAQRSLAWVPVYLIAPKLVLFMMKKAYRDPFALFFLISGLLLTVNNLDGIFTGRFFLVASFGIVGVFYACFIVAAVWFFVRLSGETKKLLTIAGAVVWLGLFGLMEAGFLLADRLL